MRLAVFLVLVLGCATAPSTPNKEEQVRAQFKDLEGHQVSVLFSSWGVPTTQQTVNSMHIYEWQSRGPVHSRGAYGTVAFRETTWQEGCRRVVSADLNDIIRHVSAVGYCF